MEKIIVCWLDRFSRSIADFGRLWKILKKRNVEFISINEAFDTSNPMSHAVLNTIMVFAQLEREVTAERVRDNYYQRARLDSWPGGPAPFGFSVGARRKTHSRTCAQRESRPDRADFEGLRSARGHTGQRGAGLNADRIPAPRWAA